MICNICASTRWQVERSDVLGLDVDLRRCLSCGFKTYNRVLKSNAEAHSSVKMADRFFRYWTNMPSRQTREQRASNERHARALYVRLLDRLQSHAARPLVDLFDVGSGWGRFMVVAKEEGFSVAGCDINPREAENGRSIGLDVQAGDFTTVDVQSESWDVVAMLDVLEHVWTPREFVEKAVGMLRPGGLLLVKTFYDEYHDEVPVDLSAGAPRYGTDGPNRGYFDPICHPSHFTRPVLRWLLERCGLSLIDEEVERSCGQVTLIGRNDGVVVEFLLNKHEMTDRLCKQCGGPLPPPKRAGRRRLYCSTRCRRAAAERRRALAEEAHQLALEAAR